MTLSSSGQRFNEVSYFSYTANRSRFRITTISSSRASNRQKADALCRSRFVPVEFSENVSSQRAVLSSCCICSLYFEKRITKLACASHVRGTVHLLSYKSSVSQEWQLSENQRHRYLSRHWLSSLISSVRGVEN